MFTDKWLKTILAAGFVNLQIRALMWYSEGRNRYRLDLFNSLSKGNENDFYHLRYSNEVTETHEPFGSCRKEFIRCADFYRVKEYLSPIAEQDKNLFAGEPLWSNSEAVVVVNMITGCNRELLSTSNLDFLFACHSLLLRESHWIASNPSPEARQNASMARTVHRLDAFLKDKKTKLNTAINLFSEIAG
ncbi:MAG TPA: hypothetical protein VHQ41_01125 [Patescibacteria group bacterium]|jgi:hypothetical protein|nr:hypothetical protein [Patescibacteria group bacterium]